MTINIYAITDSHQEARNLSVLLSGIYSYEKDIQNPLIVFDCGDLFKGIYDRRLSVNAYLKLKKMLPHANIFMTLGNNDFGFNQENFEYLKQTINEFENNGIYFVCANLKNTDTNEYSSLVPRYKIIEIDNKKILITGFCLNTSIMKNFNLEFEDSKVSMKNLIENIKEDYDHIFVLNHHWYQYSRDLHDYCVDNGIKIDLIIGGHEHSKILPDYHRNIFYPLSFARSLYKMNFADKISNIEEIEKDSLHVISEFEEEISEYEKETNLFEPIA